MNNIKIILVDDHKIVRDGLKILLMNLSDIKVIGEVSNANELFILLQKSKPDILLMDISLPKMSGIAITERISQEYPNIKVIMLTANENDEMVFNSFKAGALGYLPKDIEHEELVEAIQTVSKGEEYLAKSLSGIIMQNYFKRAKSGSNRLLKTEKELTKRELEVVKLFSDSLSYKEIAEQLNISIKTIEAQISIALKRVHEYLANQGYFGLILLLFFS